MANSTRTPNATETGQERQPDKAQSADLEFAEPDQARTAKGAYAPNLTPAELVAKIEAHTGLPFKKEGDQYKGACPCPDGPTKDGVRVNARGKLFCNKCCPNGQDSKAVVELYERMTGDKRKAVDWQPTGEEADTYDEGDGLLTKDADGHNAKANGRGAEDLTFLEEKPKDKPKPFNIPPEFEKHYEYKRDGKLVLGVWRVPDKKKGKTFRQALWDGKRYVTGIPFENLPLYNLEAMLDAPDEALIVVVEGEKTADAVNAAFRQSKNGETAVTWAGGTPAVGKTDWSPLAGRKAVVWPDNDAPGKKAAEQVVQHLQELGCPVREVQIKEDWKNTADAADFKPAEIKATVHQSKAARFNVVKGGEKPTAALNPAAMKSILKELGVEFRYNARAFAPEIRGFPNGEWGELSTLLEDALRVHISESYNNLKNGAWWIADNKWKVTINGLMNGNEVDPFVEYIEAARVDPKSKLTLDNWTDRLFKFEDEELGKWFCRFAFIAPVQRAYLPGCDLDEMPVVIGDQGSGKSRLCELLAVKGKWRGKIEWSLHPKALCERLEGTVIMEAAEMSGMGRADYNRAKMWITSKEDKDRWSYGRRAEARIRRAVFIGTANGRCLPNDPSGNRRFVSLWIEPFSTAEEREANSKLKIANILDDRALEHLYALAREAFKKGERANLPASLYAARDRVNKSARMRDEILHETLVDVIHDNPDCRQGWKLAEFEKEINKDRRQPFGTNQITAELKNIGWSNKAKRYEGALERRWRPTDKEDLYEGQTPF